MKYEFIMYNVHISQAKKISFELVIFSNSIHKESKLGKGPKDFNKNLGLGFLQNL